MHTLAPPPQTHPAPSPYPSRTWQVVYMVCSGSEANDLAWRIATANARAAGVTEPLHVVVMVGRNNVVGKSCFGLPLPLCSLALHAAPKLRSWASSPQPAA